jgi:hypothetical protein
MIIMHNNRVYRLYQAEYKDGFAWTARSNNHEGTDQGWPVRFRQGTTLDEAIATIKEVA